MTIPGRSLILRRFVRCEKWLVSNGTQSRNDRVHYFGRVELKYSVYIPIDKELVKEYSLQGNTNLYPTPFEVELFLFSNRKEKFSSPYSINFLNPLNLDYFGNYLHRYQLYFLFPYGNWLLNILLSEIAIKFYKTSSECFK